MKIPARYHPTFEQLEPRRLLAADLTVVRYFDLWEGGIIPSTDVAGITYHEPSGHLFISDSEINELPDIFDGNNVFEISLAGDQLFQSYVTNNSEPTGIAYGPSAQGGGSFYLTNDNTPRHIAQYDETFSTMIRMVLTTDEVPSATDPEGITADPASGDLYVIDGESGGVQVLHYDINLQFQDAFSLADRVTDAEGIAFHPELGHLFVVAESELVVLEYTVDGHFVEEYDISSFSTVPQAAQALTFAPTSDPNDDPNLLALYIADGGVDNFPDGRVYETLLPGLTGNRAPALETIDLQVVAVGEELALDAIAFDPDVPPDTLTFSLDPGAPATAVIDPVTGEFRWTPDTLGEYSVTVRVTDDGSPNLSDTETFSIVVYDASAEYGTVQRRIEARSDDVEQRPDGKVSINSSDLELVNDGGDQIVGLRFNTMTIPEGATILNAYVQFQVDEVNVGQTDLIIRAEDSDNAETFTLTQGDVSSRPLTDATVAWSPPPWDTKGAADGDQRTPNLASVVQEVVDRPGWSIGNSIALIISGTGERTAESYDGDPDAAPILYVEYASGDVGGTIHVPHDYSTIQDAIDAASDGDVVLVAPGIYAENVVIADKSITLASLFYITGDEAYIDQTIIDGGGSSVIRVDSSAGTATKIVGLTVQNGDDGIYSASDVEILNNRFFGNEDAVDYEGGSGIIRGNLFDGNGDDGIDMDYASEALIENNIILNSANDGIEIRLHEYSGPTLNIVIRNNVISDSREDGIQLIDYSDVSDRVFAIERNLIINNAMAGIGVMDNGESSEDYRAASMPERVYLINNTIAGNDYGLTGGDNLIAVNNLFADTAYTAILGVNGDSIAAYNLFFSNGVNSQDSNLDVGTSMTADPIFDASYHLQAGSPAIDAGTAQFVFNGETVVNLPADTYVGAAPDLGAFESDWSPVNQQPTTSGIANVRVEEDAPDTVIDLFAAFDDTEDADSLLAYSLEANTNPGLFDATSIDGSLGTLTLDYLTGATGTADITVRATDTGALFVETTFTVTVAPSQGGVITVESRVAKSSDDAEQSSSGIMYLNSSDLELTYDKGTQEVGMRFVDLDIPQAATILAAYVQFQVDETNQDVTTLEICGEAIDDALVFTSTAWNISTREKTAAAVSWSPPAWTAKGDSGTDQRTPDLAAIIQEIVDRGGWQNGNALVLLITGEGERVAESYDGEALGAPLLHVEYAEGTGTSTNRPPTASDDSATTTQNTPVNVDVLANDTDPDSDPLSITIVDAVDGTAVINKGGTPNDPTDDTVDFTPDIGFAGTAYFTYRVDDGELDSNTATVSIFVAPTGGETYTLDIRVAASDDDAEEEATGNVDLHSSDLELAFDHDPQVVGMRFVGIDLPSSAVITNAYIQFQVDETDSTPTTLTIRGEAVGDASTFTSPDGSIRAKPTTTAAVSWSPDPWTVVGEAGLDQRTPDISAVLQEIIGLPDWTAGNALAILIDGTGTRTAESYDGGADVAPLLHIEYLVPSAVRLDTQEASVDGIEAGESVEPLTEAQLMSIVDAAVLRLDPRGEAGLQELAAGLSFEITDLPDDLLGQTFGDSIWIDIDAAGYGWFVDRTPWNDQEFIFNWSTRADQALPRQKVATRVDLLTVVMHELGHALGYQHDRSTSVMVSSLPLGTRRLLDDPLEAEPRDRALAERLADSVFVATDDVLPDFFSLPSAVE